MKIKPPAALSLETGPTRTFLLLSAALMLLLYWPAIGAPFVYDDLDQIVHNPNLSTWAAFVPRFLLHPVTLASSFLPYPGTTYRPVFWLSLFADRAMFGLSPAAFHITNLCLHLLNANLLFLLLRRLRLTASSSVCAAALWLVLPVNAEAVAWISARSYELCASLVLLCCTATLLARRGRPGLAAGLCFVTAALAALSHELGFLVLPAVLLVAATAKPLQPRSLYVLGSAVTVALLGVQELRMHVGVHTVSVVTSPMYLLQALGQYLVMMFWPLHLSVERSTTLAHPQPWLLVPSLLLSLMIPVAFLRRAQQPALLLGLVWFLLALSPFLLWRNYQGIAERFTYLPSMGLAVAVVMTIEAVRSQQLRQRLLLSMAALGFLFALRTALRAWDWADPVQLYRHSLAANPQSASLHFNLGYSLRQESQLDEARTEYEKALQLQPGFPQGYASLGDLDLAQNHFAAAQVWYAKALAQSPDDGTLLLNMGTAFQGAGDLASAEAAFQRALQTRAAGSAAHVDLGVLYMKQGRPNDAMHQFAAAIDLKTKDPVPYYDLAVILQQAGRNDLAAVLYRKVLELRPDDEDALRNLQMLGAGR